MAIGDDESAESPETLKRLLSMLLRGLPIDRCLWGLRIAASDLLSLPDEVLEEIALVLREEKDLRLLDYIAEVSNKLAAL